MFSELGQWSQVNVLIEAATRHERPGAISEEGEGGAPVPVIRGGPGTRHLVSTSIEWREERV